jgi:hypothetical protein
MKPESDQLGKRMTHERRRPAAVIPKLVGGIGSWLCPFAAAALLFLAAAQLALGQPSDPILRLEVGTHNAGVFSIALDPSNRNLVTGSEDKTVRIWEALCPGHRSKRLTGP